MGSRRFPNQLVVSEASASTPGVAPGRDFLDKSSSFCNSKRLRQSDRSLLHVRKSLRSVKWDVRFSLVVVACGIDGRIWPKHAPPTRAQPCSPAYPVRFQSAKWDVRLAL